MSNMKNNEALKKHHFWILFGLVPLFVLIAVLMISSNVGGEVEKRNSEIEAAKNDLKKSSPKSKGDLKMLDEAIATVDGKRGGLWKRNWDKQKDLYTWPKSDAFTGFETVEKVDGKDVVKPIRLEDLSFGQLIRENRDQFAEFKKPEFYLAEFSTEGLKKIEPGRQGMADKIAPTQFLGGWQRQLRHVTDWGTKALTSDQIWLIMEDIWVQRSLLSAVKSVNDQMGAFERIPYADAGGRMIDDPTSKTGPHDPLRRKFKSRIWDVTIEVAKRGNRQYLKGTLENTTDRLQILGLGKMMTLKVWLEGNRDPDGNYKIAPDGQPDVEGIEPVEFYFGSEFLPGAGSKKKIKDAKGNDVEVPANIAIMQPDETTDKDFDKYLNLIPVGRTVSEIVRVEQKFDAQTVPIRRIEALQLGKTDSRYAALGTLKTPLSPPFAKVEASAAASPTTPIDPSQGGGTSLGGPGGRPRGPGMAGPGDVTGGGGDGKSGGGPIATVIDGNRNRYVDVTEQVRRMPVGIVVIVDQSYIQDALVAFANSPLRFQITQVTWTRFRGDLGTGGAGSDPSGSGSQPYFQQGVYGGGFLGPGGNDPDSPGGSMGMMMPRPGGAMPFGSSAARPGGSMPFGSSAARPGSSGMPPGSSAARPGSSGGGIAGDEATGAGAAGGMGGMGGMGGFGPFSMGGTLTTVSEAQLTSGLVELSIYGVVSLYERYDPAKDTSAPKDGATDGAKVDVKEPDAAKEKDKDEPKDKEEKKDKKDGMTEATGEPKKRIRRRAA
jgi:hypothetical protein